MDDLDAGGVIISSTWKLINLKKFLILSLWLNFFSAIFVVVCQGQAQGIHGASRQDHEHYTSKYPFIKEATTFSSTPTRSNNRAAHNHHDHDNVYDYIIVGGGTAGCPLAATLSKKYKVLLLERGGVPFNNINVTRMQNFHISLADNSSTSAAQIFISNDGVFNSRARVLGGGTCINAGFYTRASTSYVKRMGWDPKLVNESYPWVEKQIVYEPDLAPWQKALRDSLLEVGISPFNGFTYDHKYGTKVGGTIFEADGHRHTAAELLASANPEKIHVLVHAKAQRVIFDTSTAPGMKRRPRAVGVIFKDVNGNQHEAKLSNKKGSEVIVTSGALGSPQLLLLSGIGPKKDLEEFNIPVIVENQFVGKGMSDNPMNAVFVPTNQSVEQSLIQTVGITKMGVYIEASSGFGQTADSIKCHHGIVSAEIGQLTTIPPKQRTIEAIQAYRDNKQDLPFEVFKGGFVLEKIATPLSRGELKLLNTDVDNNPSVTFNYFSHPYDLKRCVEGIRISAKIIKAKPFGDFAQCDRDSMEKILNMSVQANVNLIPKQINDTESVEQFCKDSVTTIWHYHGGCQVGKVVDREYRVFGVDGMRVIDGSTFIQSPGTNPQATVMMMGRYMGVKILRHRLGKSAGV